MIPKMSKEEYNALVDHVRHLDRIDGRGVDMGYSEVNYGADYGFFPSVDELHYLMKQLHDGKGVQAKAALLTLVCLTEIFQPSPHTEAENRHHQLRTWLRNTMIDT